MIAKYLQLKELIFQLGRIKASLIKFNTLLLLSVKNGCKIKNVEFNRLHGKIEFNIQRFQNCKIL